MSDTQADLLAASREVLEVLDGLDTVLGEDWDFSGKCEYEDLCGRGICAEFGCVKDKVGAFRAAIQQANKETQR